MPQLTLNFTLIECQVLSILGFLGCEILFMKQKVSQKVEPNHFEIVNIHKELFQIILSCT